MRTLPGLSYLLVPMLSFQTNVRNLRMITRQNLFCRVEISPCGRNDRKDWPGSHQSQCDKALGIRFLRILLVELVAVFRLGVPVFPVNQQFDRLHVLPVL